jgi:hypothetical protein
MGCPILLWVAAIQKHLVKTWASSRYRIVVVDPPIAYADWWKVSRRLRFVDLAGRTARFRSRLVGEKACQSFLRLNPAISFRYAGILPTRQRILSDLNENKIREIGLQNGSST